MHITFCNAILLSRRMSLLPNYNDIIRIKGNENLLSDTEHERWTVLTPFVWEFDLGNPDEIPTVTCRVAPCFHEDARGD
jgi:hypothetical protein